MTSTISWPENSSLSNSSINTFADYPDRISKVEVCVLGDMITGLRLTNGAEKTSGVMGFFKSGNPLWGEPEANI